MSEDTLPEIERPDPEVLAQTWAQIAEQSQRLLTDFVRRQQEGTGTAPSTHEINVLTRPFQTFMQHAIEHPQQLLEAQMRMWTDFGELWQRMGQRMLGQTTDPVVAPERGDRRFGHAAWSENPVFDYIKQSYLLTARCLNDAVASTGDDKRAQQLEFQTRIFADAISPTNFLATNPVALRETYRTQGQNLVNGLKNLLGDLERGKGELRISMTDTDKFEVGENVGTAPGKVVFQTELMQLIQYSPTTAQVFRRPLLIIPPWINKFYILDLQPKNSFIRWAVDQGHTVFVISWVNPDATLAEKSFDDYLLRGSLAAMDAIERATGERELNLVGYCLGGTLLACTMAYLAAHRDDRAKSATYFASLTDFSEPGDLGVFIDEDHLALVDEKMEKDGYLDGATMATTFNSLRANDLIWSFVVNNYLLGKEPMPFDLLYWNSDSTRMPAKMHSYYLREMYLENKLCKPGGITLSDTPLDLRSVETPSYLISTHDDHIAPWRSTYAATQLYRGPTRFVLGGSGHIAGIINPPTAKKYGYWTNENLVPSPDEWLAGAEQHEGSWWDDWMQWSTPLAGDKVPARTPGDGELEVIEDAPGTYVKVRDLE